MKSRAGKTLFIWSIYLLFLGVSLLFVPNLLLGLFGIPETHEVWIRLIGMFVLLLAYFSFMSARTDNKEYMLWSVHARASVILFFTAFVLTGLAVPTLLLFGVVDLAAAAWTWRALARDRNAR